MNAVMRLVFTYFTGTPAHRVCSVIGAVAVVTGCLLLIYLPPRSFPIGILGMTAVATLFVGSSMMPLMFGRMARSHLSNTLPGMRLKLLVSGLITLLIVSSSVPLLVVVPDMIGLKGMPAALAVAAPHLVHRNAVLVARAKAGLIENFWMITSTAMLLAFWLYVALWFITSKRNTVGYLQGLTILAIVILAPTRQILQPEQLVRWDVSMCLGTLLAFSALFLAWPQLRLAAASLGIGSSSASRGWATTRTRGREIDLLLGTANPWLLAVGQLLPVCLAARIGFYSPAVWLYYLTLFSTVAGAIAGQAAERSRALWLRGDWSAVQLFLQVERSFWRHNSYVLGILLILMVGIGSYANLPVILLATGLPLLILGTVLSTYLGLMLTRRLRWSETLLAIAVMLALMAVAVLAARNSSGLAVVVLLETALAITALVLRYVARSRWARIDWMQCRPDRALSGRTAA